MLTNRSQYYQKIKVQSTCFLESKPHVTVQNGLQFNLHTKGKSRAWTGNIHRGTDGELQTVSEVFVALPIVLASSTG